MMRFREQSAPNFDRLAKPYRWLEYLTFGPLLWRCRVRYLEEMRPCRSALVLGDGDGRFTAALLRANPEIRVHAVDLSPGMIAALVASAKESGSRLAAEVADLRSWSPSGAGSYDLMVSHFFLDCLTTPEVASLGLRLAATAAPGARWVVSEFAVPRTAFGRAVAQPLVAGLYLAFGWLTNLRVRSIPDYKQSLARSGWLLEAEHTRCNGLLTSQLWRRPTLPSSAPSELE